MILTLILSTTLVILPDANPSLFYYEKYISHRGTVTTRNSNDEKHKHNHNHILQKSFQGKRVWITGASSGIGEEIAKQLYNSGAQLILSGRRIHELERVRQSCTMSDVMQHNANDFQSVSVSSTRTSIDDSSSSCSNNSIDKNVQLLPFDMTDEDLSGIVSSAINYYNGIDILILNAGIGQLSSAVEESFDATKTLMDVNFYSPVRLTLEVIKHDKWGQRIKMNSNGNDNDNDNGVKKEGHIVLTSSVAAKLPLPLGTSYAASKQAAHGYFASLRSECDPWLRVDLPCPGPIATQFQNKALKTKNRDDETNNQNKDNNIFDHDNNNNHEEDDDDDSDVKMSAERCARLIIAAMSGSKYFMQETWISKQPTLTFMYLNQYFPSFTTWVLGKIGSLRVKAFKAGLPLYKVSSWIEAVQMEKESK